MSEYLVPHTHVPRKITQLQFCTLSAEKLRQLSHIQVQLHELYVHTGMMGVQKKPQQYGPLDMRLGVSTKKGKCETCSLDVERCSGHWGYIHLALPVFHIGYFATILDVCKIICKTCGRVLLSEDATKALLKRFRNPRNKETVKRKEMLRQLVEDCKKITDCPHCGAANGTIRKLAQLRIAHDKYHTKSRPEVMAELKARMTSAVANNAELQAHIGKVQQDITPLFALQLFNKMTTEDIELIDMDPRVAHPRDMIITDMVVPPPAIRPTVPSTHQVGATTEDDLTMKLTDILFTSNSIAEEMQRGVIPNKIVEKWDQLQMNVAYFVDSNLPGFPKKAKPESRPGRCLVQRLKGKTGRFRGNLSGKRVNFTGRTVISPDPNLEIHQVGVPLPVAKILTYPERAFSANIERLRAMIRNGPEVHPGALYVIKQGKPDDKIWLKYAPLETTAKQLRLGDIVERHLCDNDYVLFNRQPSLHKLSIMCHKAKVLPGRTLRFNECVCSPYNADFDGDEMNLHVPQNEEAKADAATLMASQRNLFTPRNGEPIISATQDFLTAAYLLTSKDRFFDRAKFCNVLMYMGFSLNEGIGFPPPTILRPRSLWTGKQVFSFMVHPYKDKRFSINFETKTKEYTSNQSLCWKDGYVVFRDNQHVSGRMTKQVLGGGCKDGLFYNLAVNVSLEYSAECMARLSKMTSRWLMNFGFSIGIEDVTPSGPVTQQKGNLMTTGYSNCNEYIKLYETNSLDAAPGCTPEQTLESKLNKELSDIREQAGNMCLNTLHSTNAPLIMTLCGSKGSTINISQMVACVGQQTISGKRIGNGFIGRSLPHFALGSREPPARGFVKNSFFTGLAPPEFFFHTMGGREGLVDTAVKTADTGYMQRRLMKALEDLSVRYDSTVRNCEDVVVQFQYGDDGLDPVHMEQQGGRPVNMPFLWDKITATHKISSPDEVMHPDHIVVAVENFLAKNASLYPGKCCSEIQQFWNDQSENMKETMRKFDVVINGINGDKEHVKLIDQHDKQQNQEKLLAFSHIHPVTKHTLADFMQRFAFKMERYRTEPGTACGALGAQSIGEPATQMTLKTFHFAGVASMNITQGVPRIKEIINANKKTSTPVIEATLETSAELTSVRIVKSRIEPTKLGEICTFIEEVYSKQECYLLVEIHVATVNDLQLDINMQHIKNAILKDKQLKPLKLTSESIVINSNRFQVYPTSTERTKMHNNLKDLQLGLPDVIVAGIPTAGRAIISAIDNKKKASDPSYKLLIEGNDLLDVMCIPGVHGTKTKSNHIMVLEKVLGIEAARAGIINEITTTMGSHGLSVDVRHVQQLADVMTFKGQILGITRFGIQKMKDSSLMLASFERTTDILFQAAAHTRTDPGGGVSECIIMGSQIPVGTGSFKILHDASRRSAPTPIRKPLITSFAKKFKRGHPPTN